MKVGFVGLGNVGAKLAGSLLRNGIDLAVHDLDAQAVAAFVAKGARDGISPAQLIADCDVVITCLPSPEICTAVVEAMLPGVGPGKTWLEMSTTDATEMARLAALVIAQGGAAAECPVSGGCHRADTGNISIFAGCDRATFDEVFPLLTILGRRILHTGPIGTASTLKVMTNYLATANLLTCCEALVRYHLVQPVGLTQWPDGTVTTRYTFTHALYQQAADNFAAQGNQRPGLTGLFNAFRANTPQMFVEIDREKCKNLIQMI